MALSRPGVQLSLAVRARTGDSRDSLEATAGANYLPYVTEALSLIAAGTERLPGFQANRAIAVSCAPTFASRWLLPRLQGFSRKWPKTSVTIDTARRQVGFPIDGFDFAIRMSQEPVGGLLWTRLVGERLVPACSPEYRTRLIDPDGEIDLRRATLIHVTPAGEDWQAWRDGSGLDALDLSGGLRFDTIQLAFEAAIAGLGVALGRRPLVDRDLAAGMLVEIGAAAVAAKTAYWLVSSEGMHHRPDLLDFKRWLIAETRA